MKKMNAIDWIASILVVVGALNWGLVGFFHFNLVSAIFHSTAIANTVYGLVGLAGLWMISMLFKCGKSVNAAS